MKYFDGHNDTLLRLFLKKNNNIINNFYDGNDFANVLVKTREGRPIFIKPNDLTSATPNARVISSVLSLYDSNRLKGATKNGESVAWSDADADIPIITINSCKLIIIYYSPNTYQQVCLAYDMLLFPKANHNTLCP